MHIKGRNLLLGPITPHILRTEHADLIVQMRPEHLAKRVQHVLQLGHAQLSHPTAALPEIGLEADDALVDPLVLGDEVLVFGERGHALGQRREEIPLLDRVVHRQRAAELQALVEEGAQRHAVGSRARRACLV